MGELNILNVPQQKVKHGVDGVKWKVSVLVVLLYFFSLLLLLTSSCFV